VQMLAASPALRLKRALSFIGLVASLLLAGSFILQDVAPRQNWVFPPPFISPGQNCFEGVSPSECKPDSKTTFAKNPNNAWYNPEGMCCVTPQAGTEIQCMPSVSANCNRRAYVFIGPRGNQLARGVCCGTEAIRGTAAGDELAAAAVQPYCFYMYESYCREGMRDGTAFESRGKMGWRMQYNNVRVQAGPGAGPYGSRVGVKGGVNGNCCIMPLAGFTTRCEENVNYALCPVTITSIYIGPRGGGIGTTGYCCKRRPLSSSIAGAQLGLQP